MAGNNYDILRNPIPFRMLVGHRVHEYDPSSHAKPAMHINAVETNLINNEKGTAFLANVQTERQILARIRVRNTNYPQPLATSNSNMVAFGNNTDVQVYAKGLADYESFQYFTAGEAFGQGSGYGFTPGFNGDPTLYEIAYQMANVITSVVAGVKATAIDGEGDAYVELSVDPSYNELVIEIRSFHEDGDAAPFVIYDSDWNIIYDPSDYDSSMVGKKVFIPAKSGLRPPTLI